MTVPSPLELSGILSWNSQWCQLLINWIALASQTTNHENQAAGFACRFSSNNYIILPMVLHAQVFPFPDFSISSFLISSFLISSFPIPAFRPTPLWHSIERLQYVTKHVTKHFRVAKKCCAWQLKGTRDLCAIFIGFTQCDNFAIAIINIIIA